SWMVCCARVNSCKMNAGERKQNRGWVWLWFPISWPADATSRATRGNRSTFAPHWKKVAGTSCFLSSSSTPGVPSLGPSSNVSATARRPFDPWQAEGPNTEAERPRTAQARKAAPPAKPARAASVDQFIDLPYFAYVELRFSIIGQQAVDLLLDVGQLGITKSGKSRNPGNRGVEAAEAFQRRVGALFDAGVAPRFRGHLMAGRDERNPAKLGQRDRRAVVAVAGYQSGPSVIGNQRTG